MLRYDIAKTWRKVLVSGAFVCGISSGVVTGVMQANPASFSSPLIHELVQVIHKHGFWINLTLVLSVSLFSWANLYIGPKHSWRVIESILKEQRNLFFGTLNDEPEHNHKATLFVWKRRLWFQPWTWRAGGYLVAVAHFSDRKRNIPNFVAPINNPGLAEGVAGRAWQNKQPVYRPNLPDLNVERPSDAEFARYAKETNMPTEWVREKWNKAQKENVSMARSYSAWPIEVAGKDWGVIVINSTNPEKIGVNKGNKKLFRKYTDLLVLALEEV